MTVKYHFISCQLFLHSSTLALRTHACLCECVFFFLTYPHPHNLPPFLQILPLFSILFLFISLLSTCFSQIYNLHLIVFFLLNSIQCRHSIFVSGFFQFFPFTSHHVHYHPILFSQTVFQIFLLLFPSSIFPFIIFVIPFFLHHVLFSLFLPLLISYIPIPTRLLIMSSHINQTV